LFGSRQEKNFGERIFVIEGDITNIDAIEKCKNLHVDTVVNCAALVKHFSSGNEIETVNVGGVKNLVELCLKKNLKLIQVSTLSTVNAILKKNLPNNFVATEQKLYFKQLLTNKYVRSKFLAERLFWTRLQIKISTQKLCVWEVCRRDFLTENFKLTPEQIRRWAG